MRTEVETTTWGKIGIVAFYAYFSIHMLMKAFSYDHGDNIYKIFFVMSLFFWGVKMITTTYRLREVFWISVLMATGLMLSVITRQNTWLLLFMTISGMKNCRFDILTQLAVYIRTIALIILIAGSVIGIYDIGAKTKVDADYVQTSVYSFAMGEPNTAFLTVFLTLILLLYYNYKKLNVWWFLGTTAIALIFYKLTFCRTGIAVFFFCWVLIVFEKWAKDRKIKFLLVLSVPVGALFSLCTMLLYNENNSLMHRMNHFVSGRIYIMNTYFRDQGVSLFPRTQEQFYTSYHGLIDNAYMFVFLYGGVFIAAFFFVLLLKTQWKLYCGGHHKELVMIAAMALYGVLEQFVMNGFMNLYVLLCGILLYPGLLEARKTKDN